MATISKAVILKFVYDTNVLCDKIVKTIDNFERPILSDNLESMAETLISFTVEAKDINLAWVLSKSELEIYTESIEAMTIRFRLFTLQMYAPFGLSPEGFEKILEATREFYVDMPTLFFSFLKKIHPDILPGELVDYITVPVLECDSEIVIVSKSEHLPKSKHDKLIELVVHIEHKCSDMLKKLDYIEDPEKIR